jgi:hypothetical protein
VAISNTCTTADSSTGRRPGILRSSNSWTRRYYIDYAIASSLKDLNFKIHPAGSYKGTYGDLEVVILRPDSWREGSRSNITPRGRDTQIVIKVAGGGRGMSVQLHYIAQGEQNSERVEAPASRSMFHFCLHPTSTSLLSENKRLVLPTLRVRIHYFHTVQ